MKNEDLSPLAQQLLDDERTELSDDGPSVAQQARMLNRIEHTLQLPAPSALPSGLSKLAASKFVVVAAIGSALVIGARVLWTQAPAVRVGTTEPAATHAEAKAPEVVVSAASRVTESEPRSKPMPARDTARREKRRASAQSGADLLLREQALIERARAALVQHQPADAVAALEEHRRDFISGELSEEREALHVQALRHLGRRDDAKAAAGAFIRAHPGSIFRPLVEEEPEP